MADLDFDPEMAFGQTRVESVQTLRDGRIELSSRVKRYNRFGELLSDKTSVTGYLENHDGSPISAEDAMYMSQGRCKV